MCVCVWEQDCILLVFIFPNSVWFIHYAWLLCGLESQINRFAKLGKCFSSMGMIFKFRQLFFGNKCISKDLFFTGGIPVLHYSIQKRKQLFEEWEEEPLNLVYLSIYLSIFPMPYFCHLWLPTFHILFPNNIINFGGWVSLSILTTVIWIEYNRLSLVSQFHHVGHND